MWYSASPTWKRVHICFIALCIFTFLPIIPLFLKSRVIRSLVADELTPLTTVFPIKSDVNCVATATSSAHRGRVIAQKRMQAGRLGNDMFVYASLVGIAARNRMVPIYKCDALARTFQVTGTGSYVLLPPTLGVYENSAFR